MSVPRKLDRATGREIPFRKEAGLIVDPGLRPGTFREFKSNGSRGKSSTAQRKRSSIKIEQREPLKALVSLEKDKGFFGHMNPSAIKKVSIKGGINGR